MITQGFMAKVIKGDENSLAVIMGHELAHLTKDHVTGDRKGETALVILAFGRDDEIDADLAGMRYAVAAGYPYKTGVSKAIKEMRANTKYSSFEGLNSTHPTWEERMVLLDRDQSKLWSAMTAFQNGYVFLEIEQYLAAQQCFKAVTLEFPDCSEAWANLGYARLMQYCDGLEPDDVRRFGIGQVVTGGFYARPASLEAKVRGTDEKLWKDAVQALQRALSLQPDLALPRASLGVAYLVAPDGKDVKKARTYFSDALKQMQKDPEAKKNASGQIALLVNAGVADLAAGSLEEASSKFAIAEKLSDSVAPTRRAVAVDDAILYNQALVLIRAKDQKARALKMLETYLKRNAPTSTWWPIAFRQYTDLGKELDVKTQSRAAFISKASPQDLRPVTSITIDKQVITLSEPAKTAIERLGKNAVDETPLFPDAKIIRYRSLKRGIDIVAKDKVLAIFLKNENAPGIPLQQFGVAGDVRELKVGMSESFAKETLKDQHSERGMRLIADTKSAYHFYPLLGLGVRYENRRVAEIAIAQVPRRPLD
jgi:tetratricopeptide (TPR) repeat protein